MSIAKLHAEPLSTIRWAAIARLGWLRYVEEAGAVLVATSLDPADTTVQHRLYELAEGYPGSGRLLLTLEHAGVTADRGAYGYLVPATSRDPIEALAWLYDLGTPQYQRFAWSGRGDLLLFAVTAATMLEQAGSRAHLPESGLELPNPERSRESWVLLPGDGASEIVWSWNRRQGHGPDYLTVPTGHSVHVLHHGETVGPPIGPGRYAVHQKRPDRCVGRDAP